MTLADWRLQTAGWGGCVSLGLTLVACTRIPPSKAPQAPPAAAAQAAPVRVPPDVLTPAAVLNFLPLPPPVHPRPTPPFHMPPPPPPPPTPPPRPPPPTPPHPPH